MRCTFHKEQVSEKFYQMSIYSWGSYKLKPFLLYVSTYNILSLCVEWLSSHSTCSSRPELLWNLAQGRLLTMKIIHVIWGFCTQSMQTGQSTGSTTTDCTTRFSLCQWHTVIPPCQWFLRTHLSYADCMKLYAFSYTSYNHIQQMPLSAAVYFSSLQKGMPVSLKGRIFPSAVGFPDPLSQL